MSMDKSGHKRKNLLTEQMVRGGSLGGPTGTPMKGDVKSRRKIPIMAPLLKDQKVAGSEGEVLK